MPTGEDGRLTGQGILRCELVSKDIPLKNILEELDIAPEQCAAVGNSDIDIPMFEPCGLGIAFNSHCKRTNREADVSIHEKDLTLILPHLLE